MIEYKRVKLSELHEDPANARRHPDENLADIRASLKEFGQVEPLVVQKASGKIVGGNGRYKVMQELGWEECDVAYVDMDNMKATALGIALNRAGERAEWNPEVLAKLLAEIDDVSEELAASLKELEEDIDGGQVFDAEEVPPPELADGDRQPFQQMTFTLHDDQAEQVKNAIDAAKKAGPFVDTGNENSNGNALARIAEAYLGKC